MASLLPADADYRRQRALMNNETLPSINSEPLSCMDWSEEISALIDEMKEFLPLMKALGEDTRQQILLVLIRHSGSCGTGMRVGDIAAILNLSRPAVSHHIRILLKQDLLNMRREGTKNYYSCKPKPELLASFIRFFEHGQSLADRRPNP